MSYNATAIAVLVVAAGSTFAQIQNGSFETGLAYSGGPNVYFSGIPSPWYTTSNTPDMYDNTGVDGWGLAGIPVYNGMFAGMAACGGNRFVGFGASPSFGGINESFAQTTAPLTAGQQYTIAACMAVDDSGYATWAGGPYSGRGEVEVLLNGNLLGTFTQNTASLTWQSRSITFIAPNSLPATFEFIAQVDPTNGHASYMALDDIRIVPAPGSIALLALGGLLTRRRRA